MDALKLCGVCCVVKQVSPSGLTGQWNKCGPPVARCPMSKVAVSSAMREDPAAWSQPITPSDSPTYSLDKHLL